MSDPTSLSPALVLFKRSFAEALSQEPHRTAAESVQRHFWAVAAADWPIGARGADCALPIAGEESDQQTAQGRQCHWAARENDHIGRPGSPREDRFVL